MKHRTRIVSCRTEAQFAKVRRLFVEYTDFLGEDLSFQGLAAELATLPGAYAPPDGALLLAEDGGTAAGCAGLRKIEDGVCEMKRLYVRPAFRGAGLGRKLAVRIIKAAAEKGYRRMRLDTLGRLTEAGALYADLGFYRIPAYYENPLPGVVYWELDLGRWRDPSA